MRNLPTLLTLAFFVSGLSACSALQRRAEMQTPPAEAKTEAAPDNTGLEAPAAAPAPAPEAAPLAEPAPVTEPAAEVVRDVPGPAKAENTVTAENVANEVEITLKDSKGKIVSRSAPVSAVSVATTAATGTTVEGVPGEKALTWLHNGNLRFVRGRLRADGQSKADVRRLTSGQKPHSIVFTTSDSRVPPEIIFDQKLGEIFVVRNWGPVVDAGSVEGLEYAVRDLGVHLLLILTVKGDPKADADNVIRELGQRSDVLREALEARTLHIQTANYDLRNGVVEFR